MERGVVELRPKDVWKPSVVVPNRFVSWLIKTKESKEFVAVLLLQDNVFFNITISQSSKTVRGGSANSQDNPTSLKVVPN